MKFSNDVEKYATEVTKMGQNNPLFPIVYQVSCIHAQEESNSKCHYQVMILWRTVVMYNFCNSLFLQCINSNVTD